MVWWLGFEVVAHGFFDCGSGLALDASTMIKIASMDGSGTEEYQRPPKSNLDDITRGSMVKVFDPEKCVWHWAIIERRLKDGHLVGRIDAHCILGPTLRHGGTIFFHEDNVLFIFPQKVNPMFDSLWFRILSSLLSLGAGMKPLKRPTNP